MAYKIPRSLYESGKLPEGGGGICGMELCSFQPASVMLFEREKKNSLINKSDFPILRALFQEQHLTLALDPQDAVCSESQGEILLNNSTPPPPEVQIAFLANHLFFCLPPNAYDPAVTLPSSLPGSRRKGSWRAKIPVSPPHTEPFPGADLSPCEEKKHFPPKIAAQNWINTCIE